MKVYDSGMPEESYWNTLFDIPAIVTWLELEKRLAAIVVEVGCGYGTFTVPIANAIQGEIIAYDIDGDMITMTDNNLHASGRSNYQLHQRDVLEKGTGLEQESVDMVIFFNLLHFKERKILLKEASRILKPDGVLAVIHWRRDIMTPRGPVLELRPTDQEIIEDSREFQLEYRGNRTLLKPYHWGVQLIKKEISSENWNHHRNK